MKLNPVEERFRNVLTTVAGRIVDDLNAYTPLNDLGVDSVMIFGLITALEQEFGITISDDDLVLDNFRTFGSVSLLLKRYVDSEASSAASSRTNTDAG